jgi:hypothetical protein
MRSFSLLIIVAIFGTIAVLGAAILFASPALIPAAPGVQQNDVKYALEFPLPPPQYFTGIDFFTLKSDNNLTVLSLKSYRQQVRTTRVALLRP